MFVPPGPFSLAQPLEPRLAVDAGGLDAVGEDPEHGRTVADDPRIRRAVAPELARIGMNMYELRVLGEAAEAESEVEWRSDHANDVSGFERRAARVLEEQLVLGRQRASTRAVEENRQAPVLREEGELFPRAVPPDAAAGDHRRALGAVQQVGRFHHLTGVAER